jgi:glycosyltransferase involved in cell wall biosynthesis
LPFFQDLAPKAAFIDLSHVEEPHWLNGGHPRFGVGYQDALEFNVVTSGHVAEWMRERGADRARIRVMYTGVRPPRLDRSGNDRQRVRARYGIHGDVPLIGFAGRICEQKRPAVLAEVLKQARDAGIEFQALIIGDGELRSMLASLISKYRLQERVHMIGPLSHEDWLESLVGLDILLMPSLYEGISVALLEAMAAGVVPVVSHVGGQDEIVGADSGYLIPLGKGEVHQYVEVLSRLTGGSGERDAKSRACREVMSSTYSWRKTIDDFERILDEAQAAMPDRRCHFTPPIGRELATLALEFQRIADTHDWRRHNGGRGDPKQATPAGPLFRLTVRFCNTPFGRLLLANATLKRVGRAIVYRLLARGQGDRP